MRILALLLLTFALAGCQKKTWTLLAKVDTKNPIQECSFVDKDHGWLLAGGTVGVTADAGKTFRWATATDKDLNAICFPTSLQGWAVGNGEAIVRSSDSGSTWESQRTGKVYQHLTAVEFLNTTQGWAAGQPGVLMTTNGGVTWSKSRFLTAGRNFECQDIYVRPKGKSFAVGSDGLYAVSEDAGASWKAATLPNLGASDLLKKIYFLDDKVGWIVGLSVSSSNSDLKTVLLYKTEDGGETWVSQPCSLQPSVQKALFLSAKEGWVISDHGVFHTTDGANTWTQDNPGAEERYVGICSPQAGLIYLVTAKGQLYQAQFSNK